MSIIASVAKSSLGLFRLFDETGKQIHPGIAGGELVGQTSETVSIKRGNQIYVHDKTGRQIGIHGM